MSLFTPHRCRDDHLRLLKWYLGGTLTIYVSYLETFILRDYHFIWTGSLCILAGRSRLEIFCLFWIVDLREPILYLERWPSPLFLVIHPKFSQHLTFKNFFLCNYDTYLLSDFLLWVSTIISSRDPHLKNSEKFLEKRETWIDKTD